MSRAHAMADSIPLTTNDGAAGHGQRWMLEVAYG